MCAPLTAAVADTVMESDPQPVGTRKGPTQIRGQTQGVQRRKGPKGEEKTTLRAPREGSTRLVPLGDPMTGLGPNPTEKEPAPALGTDLVAQAIGPRALGEARSGLTTKPRTLHTLVKPACSFD